MGLRVLAVDDEADFLETLVKRFTYRQIPVTAAGNGPDALALLEREPFDVVILDMRMPGMDGLAVLQEIKKRHPLVEVIMLTGQAPVTTAVEAIRQGAFNYLKKPGEIDDLIAQVESPMGRRLERRAKVLEVRMSP